MNRFYKNPGYFAACEGLLSGGVAPVIKHMPGHGRASVDSHHALPWWRPTSKTLDATDFAPFRALSDMAMGMTAHVVYAAVDPDLALTVSRTAIDAIVRGLIGFDGLLMTDDLSMRRWAAIWLSGRAPRSRRGATWCCTATAPWSASRCATLMAELTAVVENCGTLSGQALRRAEAARASVHSVRDFDLAAAEHRLASLGLGAAA